MRPWYRNHGVNSGAEIVLDYDEVYKDGDYPVAVVVVRNEFMEEHPDLVNEFLAKHEEVTAYMQENVLKIPDMRPSQELI